MRVLALVTGIVLLVAAGALVLVVVITIVFGGALDSDTQLGLALGLIAAAVIAFPADLLIVFAVRQPAPPGLAATPGPAAGTGAGPAPMPKWASWPLLAILSPLVVVIVLMGTIVSWLATGSNRARSQSPMTSVDRSQRDSPSRRCDRPDYREIGGPATSKVRLDERRLCSSGNCSYPWRSCRAARPWPFWSSLAS
jgi:hypothetical protein